MNRRVLLMVQVMQGELEELQPKLKVAVTETDALMKDIAEKTKDADAKKAVVAIESKEAQAVAQPALDAALEYYAHRALDLEVLNRCIVILEHDRVVDTGTQIRLKMLAEVGDVILDGGDGRTVGHLAQLEPG